MADEDLVSEVKVTGINEAIAAWEAFKAAGVDAYVKIGAASKALGAQTKNAFAGVQKGIEQLRALAPAQGQIGSWDRLTASVAQTAKGLNQLQRAAPGAIERVKRLGLVTVGAGAGFLAFARVVSQSLDTAGKSTETFADEQIRAAQRANQFESAQFGFRQSVQALDRAFGEGKITFTEYNDQLRELQFGYKQTQQQIKFTQNQEESLRLETERLQAAAAKQKAFDDLVTKFGGPLTQSLVTAGRAVGRFIQILQQTLGPAVGAVIDRVVAAFQRNETAIVGFFDTIGRAIQSFVDSGGVEQTISFLGETFKVLGDILNNAVIPAFKAIKAVADGTAAAINSVFGTKLTGGVLLAVAGIGAFLRVFRLTQALFNIVSGSVKGFINLLFMLPTLLKGIGLATKTVGIGINGLIGTFTRFAQTRAQVALVAASFTDIGSKIIDVARLLPGLGAAIAKAFTNIPATLGNVATAISKVFSGTVVNNAGLLLNILPRLATAFRGLLIAMGPIGIAFALLGLAWAALEASGLSLEDVIAAVGTFLVGVAQQIQNGWKALVDWFQSAWDGAIAWVTEKFQGLLDWFATLPSAIGGVFTTIGNVIRDAFDGAVSFVKGLFSDLAAWGRQKLEPLVALLRLIKSLGGSVEAAGGGAIALAGGGSVRGPGTSTSDSIPAWLSNGEFVMRARAVATYGRAFMHAINRGQLNLSDIAAFAMGGAVGGPQFAYRPAYADGGSVGAMRPLQFVLPDGNTANAQSTDTEAKKLVRYAVAKSARSAGKKASWVGRR